MSVAYLATGFTLASLQASYNAAPTAPQIVVNGAPDPVVFRGSVSGEIFGVDDSAATRRMTVSDAGPALLDLISTTQGFRAPVMTEAQRDAIATPGAGLVVFNSTQGQLNQHNGTAWSTPGAGLTTLQGAYDNDPAGAQILLDGTPNPITIQASVAGDVFAAQDLGGNDILKVTADPDMVEVDGQLTIADPFLNAAAARSLVMSDTFTTGAAYIGGGILSEGTVTYDNTVFVWALLQESKRYEAAAGPGFAAFTLFNALPVIANSGNFDLVQALVLNCGVVHARETAGVSTVTQQTGVSFAGQARATVSGAGLTFSTGMQAVTFAPKFSTVAGATVDMGTLIGLLCVEPAVALFQPSAGTQNMTAYIGVDFPNMSFGGASATIDVIRSALNSGTNKRFLNHTGNAQSRLRGQLVFDQDLVGVTFGAGSDVSQGWGAAGFWFMQFNLLADQLRISNPSADRILFNDATGAAEFNFNCLKFSLGSQTGAVGNQIGAFVAGADTVTVGGEYSQFLLTQAANSTIDAALTLFAGWTINAPTPTIGTGSLTTAVALNVGGNPGSASVNRVGVRIISNPSGGSGINAALWVTAGLSRFDGRVDINNGIALGAGGAATLGNVGGSGPTATAQAQWVEIDIGGVPHWIPAWT